MSNVNVRNASDKKQIKEAERKVKDRRKVELEDLKIVLSTGQGRRVLWRLMSKCRPFESIWESSARIHYNAGQQDLGHFIMGEISLADENALFSMMKEAANESS